MLTFYPKLASGGGAPGLDQLGMTTVYSAELELLYWRSSKMRKVATEQAAEQETNLLDIIQAEAERRFERFMCRRAINTSGGRGSFPEDSAWSFAVDYGLAVEEAIRDFAGMLTQAFQTQARKVTRTTYKEILDIVLRAADQWVAWDFAATFLMLAKGVRNSSGLSSCEKNAFMKELDAFSGRWIIVARQSIRLHSFLSTRPQPRRSAPVQLDKTTQQIARTKQKNSKI